MPSKPAHPRPLPSCTISAHTTGTTIETGGASTMAGRWSPPFLLALAFLSLVPVYSADEVDSLLKFKASVRDPTGALQSWNANTAPCNEDTENWSGLICDNGRILGLQLENMSLSGPLSLDVLKNLPGLRTLSFFNNSFEGPMPYIRSMRGLRSIYLSMNKLSGTIPGDAFSGMSWLKKIHLSHNELSGPIPASVADLPKLLELMLQDNKFSGKVPDLRQEELKRVNLANNNLEGQIPESLSKMGANAFAGNKGLCGTPLGAPCPMPPTTPPPPSSSNKSSNHALPIILAVVFITIIIIVVALLGGRQGKQKEATQLGRPSPRENARAAEPNLEEGAISKSEGSVSASVRRAAHEQARLLFVKEDRERFELQDLLKSTAEVLGTASLGCTYKATLQSGLSVVVKRFKDMNKVGREDFDEHMRRLGRLSHPNLLPLVAYYYRKEEKLMVTDYIPKRSLAIALHGTRNASNPPLDWSTRLKIIKGVGLGLAYLYDELQMLSVPHGHLKSSNVLLSDSFEPLLTDYALLPVMNPNQAAQAMVAYKSPEHKQHGRTSKKSDVWSFGVLILEIMTGKIPATDLQQGQEGVDLPNWVSSVIKEELKGKAFDDQMKASDESKEDMFKMLQIGLACCESNVDKRCDIVEAVDKIEELKADKEDEGELSVVTV